MSLVQTEQCTVQKRSLQAKLLLNKWFYLFDDERPVKRTYSVVLLAR